MVKTLFNVLTQLNIDLWDDIVQKCLSEENFSIK